MLSRLRALLVVLVALAFAATLIAPTPATAAPQVTPQSNWPAPNYRHTVRISSGQYNALKLAAKLRSETKGRTMDYRKAKKVFGNHYDYRRQFAAGWKTAGGKISHVSKAELKAIEASRKKHQPRYKAAMHGFLQAQDGTNCTGTTKYVRHSVTADYPNEYWYDSCATNDITRDMGWCMGGAGAVGLLAGNPGVAALMGIMIAGCGASSGWIGTAQDNSRKHAVIIYTGRSTKYIDHVPGPNEYVQYQMPIKVVPQ